MKKPMRVERGGFPMRKQRSLNRRYNKLTIKSLKIMLEEKKRSRSRRD
jgi:hypothetical protein